MLTRRKKPQQFSSGVEFAVSAGLLLYRQQTPSPWRQRHPSQSRQIVIFMFS
jgi:hypothetical protein